MDWNQSEFEILREKYPIYGSNIPELQVNHTFKAIRRKAGILKIKCNFNGQFKKGSIPPKILKESRKKQGESIKGWYKSLDKTTRDGIVIRLGNARNTFNKKLQTDSEFRERYCKKISEGKKGKKFTEEHKEALSKAHFSKKSQGKQIFEQIGQSLKKRYDSGEIQPWNKNLTKETDIRIAEHPASQPHSKEWIENVRKASHIRPNGPESKFIELCNKYNLPYRYVGDGQFWLGYPPHNPDFLNINGKKEVVEIHGIYWHLLRYQKINPSLTKEDVERRDKNLFAEYGFDCKIIWDDELDNDEFVLNRLL